jgi:single-strand DNA-binding protein
VSNNLKGNNIMNIITITGRLTAAPMVRTSGGNVRALFTVAVERPVKRDDNNKKPADYPSFVAFGKTAEVLRDYAVKGQALEIQGHIATSTYDDKDGERKYSTELIADRIQLGAKPRNTNTETDNTEPDYDDYPADDFEGASV